MAYASSLMFDMLRSVESPFELGAFQRPEIPTRDNATLPRYIFGIAVPQ